MVNKRLHLEIAHIGLNWKVMDSLKNSMESYTILNDMKLYPVSYVSLFLVIPVTFTCYAGEKMFKTCLKLCYGKVGYV